MNKNANMNEAKKAENRCLTVKEAAERLNIHWSTTYRLVKDGKLGAIHIGRAVRIPVDALEAFMEAPTPKPAEPERLPQRRIITKIV